MKWVIVIITLSAAVSIIYFIFSTKIKEERTPPGS
jgi:hypothetical protein